MGKEMKLCEIEQAADPRRVASVIRYLAGEIKASRAVGGVLMVQTGAAALVYANRCPSIRAVLGSCMEAVEQGVQQVAANVLVIEHPHKSFQQIRNLMSRFVRGPREPSEDVKRQLQELASCG